MYKMRGWNRYPRSNRNFEEEQDMIEKSEEGVIQRYCKSWGMVYIALCTTCTVILVAVVLVLLFLERLGLSSPTST